MKKIKFTVLKTTFDRKPASEYKVEYLTTCLVLKAGQVFYTDYAKPENFCDEIKKATCQYAFAFISRNRKRIIQLWD